VLDIDLRSYFDTISHAELFKKIATRVNDKDILHLIKLIVKAGGRKWIGQGSPLTPLLSNIYLNEVDKMLGKAKEVSRQADGYEHKEYVRWADDLEILVEGQKKWSWLEQAIHKRLREEHKKIKVEINEEKTRTVDLHRGEGFSYLGFDFRPGKTRKGKMGIYKIPMIRARAKLLMSLKEIFSRYLSQAVSRVIYQINPVLQGWVNYFRIGNLGSCFRYIRSWVEKRIRRHLTRMRKKQGYGWERWISSKVYEMGLYNDYQIRYYQLSKAAPSR